jgi:hypothetical protein
MPQRCAQLLYVLAVMPLMGALTCGIGWGS